MQTIWKGTVSFGLVSIPVRLYSATEERDVSFHQVHAADGGRVRYKRFCQLDGEEVPYKDIAKGYQLPDGDTIVLTNEDFAALPLPSRRAIDVLQFVPADQIDSVAVSRSYYLQADPAGVKPYVLLRDALANAGRAAVVKVALRNREALAAVRPRGEVLVLQTMLWPDEVRDPAALAPAEDVTLRPQEVAMAESYIATLSEDFHYEGYTDDYRTALEELVSAKAAGREVTQPEESDSGGTVVDLMAALRASVDAAKARRGEAGQPPAESVPKTAAKRPAKKVAKSSAAPVKRPARPAAGTRTTKKAAAKKTA